MLVTLLAVVAVSQGQAPVSPQQITPSSIVQKMLSKYAGADSMYGRIKLTQTSSGAKVVIDTELQFDKPSKIFLRQVRQSSEPRSWLVLSDGVLFSYDKPDLILGSPRFVEKVKQGFSSQTFREMYGAAARSIGDKSPILDIAVGRPDDMRAIMNQWATMKIHSRVKLKETEVTAIVGDFREGSDAPVSGSYEAYISDDSEFLRFVLKQKFAVPNNQTVEVVSIWDADLKVNSPTDVKLYNMRG